MKRLLLLLALLIFAPAHARAWGDDGHRIVCAIAWDELSPSIQARVASILDIPGKAAFAESCYWADDVRMWRAETAPHHFINLPRGGDEIIDLARDCPQPRSCDVVAVDEHARTLRQYYSADALRFLGHYVGDLHQLLHTGYADDRGGNLIGGTFLGEGMTMRDLWDTYLLAATRKPWPILADDLHARITQAQRWVWLGGTPSDWANETHTLVRTSVVGYHAYDPGFVFGQDYFDANIETIYVQLQRAGVRLAELITNALQ